tara:strand:+ start:248368 stop:249024 length:657 start_codon:yes stop_codon:yes gene_type:complete
MKKKNDKYRNEYRQTRVGKSYLYLLHLIANFGILIITCVFLLSLTKNVNQLELLIVPLMFVIGNFAVWFIHKYPLHKKGFFLGSYSFQKHTVEHHTFFTEKDNVFDSLKDLHIVLFPTVVVAGFSFILLPVAYFLLQFVFSQNVVGLILFGSALYFILYEVVHTCSHLPKDHWILKIKHLRNMWEHHRVHHDPRYMSSKNFGIVSHFADRVLKTYVKM